MPHFETVATESGLVSPALAFLRITPMLAWTRRRANMRTRRIAHPHLQYKRAKFRETSYDNLN